MKKNYSKSWNSSKNPGKQRKFRAKAPKHIQRKFMTANLTKPLREKHKKRSVPVRVGDRVKILRGQFKGHEAKIERVDVKNSKVYLEKIRITKRDGSETSYPIHASNLQIVTMVMDDKNRLKERKVKKKKKSEKKTKEEQK
ncbi:MAG: 50S ribosomal protein L24 [Nanoarchaeota archaeon]|nr:50S ribosomal protein L24 [Nanoarchaeota archaeon]